MAGFAAVVSYSHIYDLGRAHGQEDTAARLLMSNVIGSINILTVATEHRVQRVVNASTGGAIYGAEAAIPTCETEPTKLIAHRAEQIGRGNVHNIFTKRTASIS